MNIGNLMSKRKDEQNEELAKKFLAIRDPGILDRVQDPENEDIINAIKGEMQNSAEFYSLVKSIVSFSDDCLKMKSKDNTNEAKEECQMASEEAIELAKSLVYYLNEIVTLKGSPKNEKELQNAFEVINERISLYSESFEKRKYHLVEGQRIVNALKQIANFFITWGEKIGLESTRKTHTKKIEGKMNRYKLHVDLNTAKKGAPLSEEKDEKGSSNKPKKPPLWGGPL